MLKEVALILAIFVKVKQTQAFIRAKTHTLHTTCRVVATLYLHLRKLTKNKYYGRRNNRIHIECRYIQES